MGIGPILDPSEQRNRLGDAATISALVRCALSLDHAHAHKVEHLRSPISGRDRQRVPRRIAQGDGTPMSSNNDYTPPKVWIWEKPRDGEEWRYSGVNRPIA